MQKFIDFFDQKALAHWWELRSNQLAVVFAVAMAWAVENQHIVMEWVNQIEQPYRSILTFIVMAGVPIFLRIRNQPRLAAKISQETEL